MPLASDTCTHCGSRLLAGGLCTRADCPNAAPNDGVADTLTGMHLLIEDLVRAIRNNADLILDEARAGNLVRLAAI